jgi:predicted metalloenzyme YecM
MNVDFEKFKHNFESLQKSVLQQMAKATRDSVGLTCDRQRCAEAASAAAAAAGGEMQPAACNRTCILA